MKFTDMLSTTKSSLSLSLFNIKTIRAVELGLLEKNGKYYEVPGARKGDTG
jgi:hypothetical protein